MKFTKIQNVLKQTEKNYKLEEAALKYKLFRIWEQVITGFLFDAKDSTRAIDFSKGVLTVAALGKEIAEQIRAMSKRIIYELNFLIGKEIVYSIQVEY